MRRNRARLPWLSLLPVAIVLLGLPRIASGQDDQLYVVTEIGSLAETSGSMAYAVNNTAQVVGSCPVSGAKPKAWHWQSGTLKDINDTIHFNYWYPMERGEAYDISDNDQIVGGAWYQIPGDALPWREDPLQVIHAYILRPAVQTDFGTPYPGDATTDLGGLGADIWLSSCATAISNANHVVGWADVRIEESPPYRENVYHAFLVRPNGSGWFTDADDDMVNDLMIDLGTLNSGDELSAATDVNDNGWVVGYSYGPEPHVGYTAFLIVPEGGVWANLDANVTNSLMQSLGTLGGVNSWARGINNDGIIVGESDTADLNTHAFVYRDGMIMDLGTLGGNDSCANAINNDGIIVGWAETTDRKQHACMWVPEGDGYRIIDLNAQIILTKRWKMVDARDITDNGEIAGWAALREDGDSGGYSALLLEKATEADLALLQPDENQLGDLGNDAPPTDQNGPADPLNLNPIFPDGDPNAPVVAPFVPTCGAGIMSMLPLMVIGMLGLRRRY